MAASSPARSINIAILAMGGEGGGVLADWLVDMAEHGGFLAQTTSVPGVAQRTGATIYYLELFAREAAEVAGREPVLALTAAPGDVDLVVASELMEAGRAVSRGFVTPGRTTLVASTHRVYSMTERLALSDGRVNSAELIEGCRMAAKTMVAFDMAGLAEATGSVISAVLFGAVAGSGALPFGRAAFEDAIRRGGIGVKTSLAAFTAGFEAAQSSAALSRPHPEVVDQKSTLEGGLQSQPTSPSRPAAEVAQDEVAHVGARAAAQDEVVSVRANSRVSGAPHVDIPANADTALHPPTLDGRDADSPTPGGAPPRAPVPFDPELHRCPEAARDIVRLSLERLADYQDADYAKLFVERLRPIVELETKHPASGGRLTAETARQLVLGMSYEDAIRVAELKIRPARFKRVGEEVRAGDGQILHIAEFMHPRMQEIADTLPANLGRWLLRTGWARGLLGRFTSSGRIIRTTTISGFLLLYGIASLRPMRPRSLRWEAEQSLIERWLAAVREAATRNYDFACEVAECRNLVKGYGETHARGLARFETIMGELPRLAGLPDAARELGRLRKAATTDETGAALAEAVRLSQTPAMPATAA